MCVCGKGLIMKGTTAERFNFELWWESMFKTLHTFASKVTYAVNTFGVVLHVNIRIAHVRIVCKCKNYMKGLQKIYISKYRCTRIHYITLSTLSGDERLGDVAVARKPNGTQFDVHSVTRMCIGDGDTAFEWSELPAANWKSACYLNEQE